jgi:hypothetical protein
LQLKLALQEQQRHVTTVSTVIESKMHAGSLVPAFDSRSTAASLFVASPSASAAASPLPSIMEGPASQEVDFSATSSVIESRVAAAGGVPGFAQQ